MIGAPISVVGGLDAAAFRMAVDRYNRARGTDGRSYLMDGGQTMKAINLREYGWASSGGCRRWCWRGAGGR